MVDKRPHTPRGFRERLKNFFRAGSSRSNLPTATIDLEEAVKLQANLLTRTIDPEEAAKLRAKYTHFRVLIIGRANAGKTTILRRVCNTTEDPVYGELQPTHERGIHDVRHPFSFKSNPQFIFHDSPGFEAGGEEELLEVQSFIQEKAKSKEVHDQIHVIWFCFTPNASRPLLDLEKRFFNEHRAWNVPVVAIFTKFDDLIVQVYEDGKNKDENRMLACATLEEKFELPLKGFAFPPCGYVRFESIHKDEGNHQEQVGELMRQTAASINDLALKMLFVSVQKNNLEICIECAVKNMKFQTISETNSLLEIAVTWFGHSYKLHDYGQSQDTAPYYYDDDYDYDDGAAAAYYAADADGYYTVDFVSQVTSIVHGKYKKPSVHALAAILICLELSFWHTQNGLSSAKGFKTAWSLYIGSHQAKVDTELKKQFEANGVNDWFGQYAPSPADHDAFIKIILENLLSHSDPSTRI